MISRTYTEDALVILFLFTFHQIHK